VNASKQTDKINLGKVNDAWNLPIPTTSPTSPTRESDIKLNDAKIALETTADIFIKESNRPKRMFDAGNPEYVKYANALTELKDGISYDNEYDKSINPKTNSKLDKDMIDNLIKNLKLMGTHTTKSGIFINFSIGHKPIISKFKPSDINTFINSLFLDSHDFISNTYPNTSSSTGTSSSTSSIASGTLNLLSSVHG
jgi:hypothetical protein